MCVHFLFEDNFLIIILKVYFLLWHSTAGLNEYACRFEFRTQQKKLVEFFFFSIFCGGGNFHSPPTTTEFFLGCCRANQNNVIMLLQHKKGIPISVRVAHTLGYFSGAWKAVYFNIFFISPFPRRCGAVRGGGSFTEINFWWKLLPFHTHQYSKCGGPYKKGFLFPFSAVAWVGNQFFFPSSTLIVSPFHFSFFGI